MLRTAALAVAAVASAASTACGGLDCGESNASEATVCSDVPSVVVHEASDGQTGATCRFNSDDDLTKGERCVLALEADRRLTISVANGSRGNDVHVSGCAWPALDGAVAFSDPPSADVTLAPNQSVDVVEMRVTAMPATAVDVDFALEGTPERISFAPPP